ncbi:phosphoglycerate mutase family protein [Henriciella sp. AS95]|uniref:SixA phosphatase family protein n=1 Tax=Henriciella sp. AS95 TaxID=3135782 RepID=UPI00317917AA
MNPFRAWSLLGIIVVLLSACSGTTGDAALDGADGSYTLYLVRHAEKVVDVDNPPLSPEGETRATELAEMLKDAGIKAIWSTDYLRTEQTAGPLAAELGIEIEFYDPGDLEAFAETLRGNAETALVVGHSNTTPDLSAALGGEPGEPIFEPAEYDRLYVLTGVGTGTVETEIKRFGARYDPDEG